MLTAALAAGCSSSPRNSLPPGVSGYSCVHSEITPGGEVKAEAMPDYRNGGYRGFIMVWMARRGSDDVSPASATWISGRDAIEHEIWLTVTYGVEMDPPYHVKIRFQLSTGEFIDRGLLTHETSAGRVHFVTRDLVTDSSFIEKFTQAAWMDIGAIDAQGVNHALSRLDLTGVPEAVARMRELAQQVAAEAADYRNRCVAIPVGPIEEVIVSGGVGR